MLWNFAFFDSSRRGPACDNPANQQPHLNLKISSRLSIVERLIHRPFSIDTILHLAPSLVTFQQRSYA